MPVDEWLFAWIHRGAGRLGRLDRAAQACARYGAGGEVALMLMVGVRYRRAGGIGVVLRCLTAVAGLYALLEAIGVLVPRARPFANPTRATALLTHGASRSFPSRHVACAVAMATIADPVGGPLARAMALLAGALGLARVRAGVHYPSDVAVGAAVGWLVGRLLRPASG